ncbi:solute carrier family 22 member 6-like [Eriocheir sinensis]|uniref:solute carrier family 22 member 6-like n=1 Tax=Eriocheir sinensis TaxID=95602 RepID=UPI0021C99DA2|nr:solute carrier family 22 member 6-like [Eriocheir sinensis]
MSSNCKFSLQQLAEYYRSPGMRIILLFTPLICDNPFMYVGLTGLMDGCSILMSTPATPFLGRRVMIGVEFLAGGILILLELIIPDDYPWVKWVLVMVGFLLVAGAFQVNFIYAPELFPTQARARGFALVNTVGSIGFMFSPLITTIFASFSPWAPGLVFGCSGILASMLVLPLPETNKKPLPETLQDVDERYWEDRIKSKKSKAGGIDNLSYKHDVKSRDKIDTEG